MESTKYPDFYLANNSLSRTASNTQFCTGQIPLRKPLCEINENNTDDSFSFLEEPIPRHIPQSFKKVSIDINHDADLDKTVLHDPTELIAMKAKENLSQIPTTRKQPSIEPTLIKKTSESALILFKSIMKGDIHNCIMYLNKRYRI